MKGKVLSVRISEKDLASCVELCNSVHLKPIGMGGYLTKTLGILLENLRQSHKIMNMSESQAKEVLKQTFGDREVGYSCDLPDSFADFSLSFIHQERDPQVSHFDSLRKEPKVPHFNTAGTPQVEVSHVASYTEQVAWEEGKEQNTIPTPAGMVFHFPPDNELDETIKFDQDLEEEIRLSAMLEGESLIDKLLITEHRKDDKETKLMNPDLAGPVLTSEDCKTKKEGDEE